MASSKKYQIVADTVDYVVVNKSAGILTIPGRNSSAEDLRSLLTKEFNQDLLPVHRIDRGTSGLVIMAKNKESHKELNRLFRERQIDKTYLAFVKGRFFVADITLDQPIMELASGTSKVSNGGKPSITSVKVIQKFRSATLIEVKPITGRTHQIRVHMQHAGFPLLIDPVYGQSTAFFLSSVKRRKFNLAKDTEERPLVSRLTLHCAELAWTADGEQHSYTAPLPKDLNALLKQLNKWDNY